METKNYTQVLIDGKIYTLGGSEDEAYLQRTASYVNEKLAAMRPACRELYESHYSKQAFSDSLQQAVKELTGE